MKTNKDIISSLPYSKGFLFVDEITHIDKDSINGTYTFRADEFFYASHFKEKAVTPGVILLECMGQIGLVAHGIFLLQLSEKEFTPMFSHAESEFFEAVYPGDKVHIKSKKKFLRKNSLRSEITMTNINTGNIIARANALCTFIINSKDE